MERDMSRRAFVAGAAGAAAAGSLGASAASAAAGFRGRWVAGEGEAEHLELLDVAFRSLWPDPEIPSLTMLYSPAWNGFVEGPTWGAWWVQNSYGTTLCGLPFFGEPYTTWIANAQHLWFSQMGDGKRQSYNNWVAPDGCLCDCASPGSIIYKQGDGRTDIHDWGMEFTAAGIVLQCELLLVRRNPDDARRYLPMLRRSASFIESRRDPKNDLYLAGAAGNLLAPSFAGSLNADGSYGKAYLAGLSVTQIAALERLARVEEMAGNAPEAAHWRKLRAASLAGLPRLQTPEGSLIKYMDPDGTRHGVYGAAKHGYYEAVCNHDAVALDVVDDATARRIMRQMASISGLRPHGVIITNHPSLDDMYTAPNGLWEFGTWVNGGHWTTCEARMMMAYHRTGRFEEARRAWRHILGLMRKWRADNPLVKFGAEVYQPNLPINVVYDTWGAPVGLLRGLLKYDYDARGLRLTPQMPPTLTRYEQQAPAYVGSSKVYVETAGVGQLTGVWLNGRKVAIDDGGVHLPADKLRADNHVALQLGHGRAPRKTFPVAAPFPVPAPDDALWSLGGNFGRVGRFHAALRAAKLGNRWEARQAVLVAELLSALRARREALAAGKLLALPEASAKAADAAYTEAAARLLEGLGKAVDAYATEGDQGKVKAAWDAAK